MRIQGKITAWNASEGYGYITPATGAKQVWVHYTGFIDRTRPPEVGQIVTFSMHTDDDGQPCAEEVSRPGDKIIVDEDERSSWSFTRVFLFLLLLALAGYFAYQKYHQEPAESAKVIAVPSGTPPKVTQPN